MNPPKTDASTAVNGPPRDERYVVRVSTKGFGHIDAFKARMLAACRVRDTLDDAGRCGLDSCEFCRPVTP